MVIVRQLPAPLRAFFDTLKPHFQRRAWRHIWALVLAIAIATGRRNVSTLYQQIQADVYRQKYNDFLTLSPWQGPVVLQGAARQVLGLLDPQPGEWLEAILDASGTRKRGQTMEAAHYYWDPQLRQKVWGHRFVLLILRIRGVVLPWALALYRPKAFCRSPKGRALGLPCKTLSQLAADLLQTLPEDLRAFFRIRVLFDAGFFNQIVVGTCQALGWRYVSVAKANRAFWPDHYRGKRQVGKYGPGVLRYEGQEIRLPNAKGQLQRFRVAERTGSMRKVGRGKVVFSRRLSDGSFLVLVTDDFSLSAREVVAAYQARWAVEVTLKQLKQHLGLGQYQTTIYEGVVHHLHLVCLAHLLLTSLGLQDPGMRDALQRKMMLKLAPLGTRQAHLRALIWHDNLQRLRRLPHSRMFIQKLAEVIRFP